MAAVLRQPLVYFRALRRKLRSPAVASIISSHKAPARRNCASAQVEGARG
ncbi:hypothetical protein Agau_C201037 [Agrobacterium tumefaciens F2]|nr:hypothetical protein Agau_C201037 [Agrobacterium tumefaciens F2]